jgi:hypothetical protein
VWRFDYGTLGEKKGVGRAKRGDMRTYKVELAGLVVGSMMCVAFSLAPCPTWQQRLLHPHPSAHSLRRYDTS